MTLLDEILEAHGGERRWREVRAVRALGTFGGPFWRARGWGGHEDVRIEAHVTPQRIAFSPFPSADLSMELTTEPERVVLRDASGAQVAERTSPRSSFPGYSSDVHWDALQISYFAGAAMWTYLNTPFLLGYPGVETRELSPWVEEGETWHRLAAVFPSTIATHNREQIFYFDQRLVHRRVDYSPDVTGRPAIAHLCEGHERFGGFLFPTRRSVHPRDASGRPVTHITPITLHFASIEVDRG